VLQARVAVGSLGGTITMTAVGPGGVRPTLGAADLVEALGPAGDGLDVTAATLATLPGASLTTDDVLDALRWADAQVAGGAAGAVLVQGTDTLEETAYLLDLHWARSEPLVVTGAMRPPAAPGADGPANLVAAVRTAAAPAARGRGVLVVLDDEIHAAARVRKTSSTATGAFVSPVFGPLGVLVEGDPVFRNALDRPAPLALPPRGTAPWVPLLEAALGEDGTTLRAVCDAGCAAVVVSAFGAGHVSAAAAEVVGEVVAAGTPVVVASRTGSGTTLTRTYGFPGSEPDLAARGACLAGWLDARKARILVRSLLAAGAGQSELRAELGLRGGTASTPSTLAGRNGHAGERIGGAS
jgi:L-asparaginase